MPGNLTLVGEKSGKLEKSPGKVCEFVACLWCAVAVVNCDRHKIHNVTVKCIDMHKLGFQ